MKKKLEECYRILGQMTVSGENVLLLAAAMQALRATYAELTEERTDEASEPSV